MLIWLFLSIYTLNFYSHILAFFQYVLSNITILDGLTSASCSDACAVNFVHYKRLTLKVECMFGHEHT